MRPAPSRPNRGKGDRRGAAMTEMAILLPVIALLVFGMVEASRLGMVAQQLANIARSGCRVAVVDGKTSDDVTAHVNTALTDAGINPALVNKALSPTTIESTTTNDQISLTLSVNFSQINWFSSPFFFRSTTVTGRAVMQSEHY